MKQYSILIISFLFLAGCCSAFHKGKEIYEDVMYRREHFPIIQPEEAHEQLLKAKEFLIEALATCNLSDERKILVCSIIARIYCEEENFDKASEYIWKVVEKIDPYKNYKGDEALIAFTKGEALKKMGQDAFLNFKEKDEQFKRIALDQALRYFDEALTNYFTADGKVGEKGVKAFIDKSKFGIFLARAEIWEKHTWSGEKEALKSALQEIKRAKEIAEHYEGTHFSFASYFHIQRLKLEVEIEHLIDEINK